MKCIILLLILVSSSLYAQVEIDVSNVNSSNTNNCYDDYSDQLLIKVMSVVKSNDLEIINKNNKKSIVLKPYGMSSLGFGFNYKWLGLGIGFGLPASPEDEKIYGETQRFDFQLNVYSRKFVVDAFAQQYTGYHIENVAELIDWEGVYFPQRESMKTFAMGIGGYYVFNHEKLSYKAAYVRNSVQKKSAGSFLLGGFYNIDYGGFDGGDTSSFVPDYFPVEIQDSLPIDTYTARSVGVSFGYTYTFVFFKRFFINLSLIPGLGVKSLTVTKSGDNFKETTGVGRFNGRVALGYENKNFLLGLTSNSVTGNLDFEDYEIKPTTKNVKFFIAKRFNIKKKKARLE
tara:strand:+ start:9968 stop:10996 length:1029 start_codon:yes stop_codon:yes gene_type:complete